MKMAKTQTQTDVPQSKTGTRQRPIAVAELPLLKLGLKDEIRARAYQLYTERGARPGSAIEDWLQAEAEILASHAVEIIEPKA